MKSGEWWKPNELKAVIILNVKMYFVERVCLLFALNFDKLKWISTHFQQNFWLMLTHLFNLYRQNVYIECIYGMYMYSVHTVQFEPLQILRWQTNMNFPLQLYVYTLIKVIYIYETEMYVLFQPKNTKNPRCNC